MPNHNRPRPPRTTRPRNLAPLAWSLAGVVVLVALFGVGAAVENVGRTGSDRAAATGRPTKTATAGGGTAGSGTAGSGAGKPGIGERVRDGNFEFVVSRVDCSATTVGKEHLKARANGRFCIVTVTVHNVTDKPRFFSGSAQKAYDAKGAEFGDDGIAGFYANGNRQLFVREIDPGGTVTGKLVFDVPRKAKLSTVRLHDSFLSRGVVVVLD